MGEMTRYIIYTYLFFIVLAVIPTLYEASITGYAVQDVKKIKIISPIEKTYSYVDKEYIPETRSFAIFVEFNAAPEVKFFNLIQDGYVRENSTDIKEANGTFVISAPGTHTVIVQGLDANKKIIGSDSVTFNVYFGEYKLVKTVREKTIRVKPEEEEIREILKKTGISIEKVKETAGFVDVEKKIKFIEVLNNTNQLENHTMVTVAITPKKTLYNISVYEQIPKSAAQHASEIIFYDKRHIIVEPDPLIVWHFAEINSKVELSYEIRKELIKDTKTMVVEESKIKKEAPVISYKVIIPVLLIPLIVFIFVFFQVFGKPEKTK